MRADRLLSLLLLLQNQGRCSAHDLADALDVSIRTIYRDTEALSMAGVPIYAERGPGGGISLVDSYRTTLTGLTKDEVQALFLINIPAALEQLGISQNLKTALLKLSASLPEALRNGGERFRQRIYLDSSPWSRNEESLSCPPVIQKALWNNQRLRLRYTTPFATESEGVGDPYGLVAKANVWHLIFAMGGRFRVLQVSDILEAEPFDETFIRSPDFELERFWDDWLKDVEQNPPVFLTRIRAAPGLMQELYRRYGKQISEQIIKNEPDADGWFNLTIAFDSFFTARERLLGFDAAIEVIEPIQLRLSMADFGRQIADRYSDTKYSIDSSSS